MHVAYKTKCSIYKLLSLKPSMNWQNKFQNSGICKIMCGEFGKKHNGQTGRKLWNML